MFKILKPVFKQISLCSF